jgi:hypothetical protein
MKEAGLLEEKVLGSGRIVSENEVVPLELGINYEFRSGLVVGAEAMFDWLANAPTTFTALEPNGRHSDWNDQQSLDHHGDG